MPKEATQPRTDEGKFARADGTNKSTDTGKDAQEGDQSGNGKTDKSGKAGSEDISGIRQFAAGYLEVEAKEIDTDAGDDKGSAAEAKKAAAKSAKKEAGTTVDKGGTETPPPKRKPAPAAAAATPLTRKDVEEVVETIVKKGQETKEPEKKEDPYKDLGEDQQYEAQVLEQMERQYPDKYKGVAKKYTDGQRNLKTYIADWKKKNPGQEFDDKDPEHDAFFQSNDVDWVDAHFKKAERELIKLEAKREAKEEIEKDLKPKLSEFERKEKLRDSEREIMSEQTVAAKEFWKKSGDDLNDMVNDTGAVNLKKLKELEASDPDLYAIRISHAEAAEAEAKTLYLLMNNLTTFVEKPPVEGNFKSPELYQAAVQEFRTHQDLAQFMADREAKLAAKPEEERRDANGRDFLPAAKYFALPKDQRAAYWTFSARDGATMRARWRAAKANEIIQAEEERFNRRAKHKNLIKDEAEDGKEVSGKKETPVEPAKEEDEIEPTDTDGKPTSPGSFTKSKMAAKSEQGKDGPKSGAETFIETYLQ